MAGRSGSDRAIARSGRTAGDGDAAGTARSGGHAASTNAFGDDEPSDDADGAAPTVVERTVYRDGETDGAVDLAIVYEIPDAVSRLAFWIERPEASVVATDGFEPSDVGSYSWQGIVDGPAFEWDGTGDRATVVLRQPLAGDEPATYGAGTDDWALLLRPRTHTRWRYRGTEPQIGREAEVLDGGVAGEQFALLGEHDVAERTVTEEAVAGRSVEGESVRSPVSEGPTGGSAERTERANETLRLVVPEAADLAEGRDRVLDSLVAASERLAVGGRNDVVTVFVAPTDGVTWAHRGLSLGPDARVNDIAPLAAPANVWVHEYVHTRQDRGAVTRATEWLLEATAEYYAVTQAFERGAIGFQAYRHVLERGIDGQQAGSVLADPSTWADDAQYRKGALVVAALDRRIRAATGGEATFQAVLRAWNDAAPEPFDDAAFAEAVEAAGGPAARAAAVAYTQSPTTPKCWSAAAHAAVFDVSPADHGVEGDGEKRFAARATAGRDSDLASSD